uniref:ZP domain-containing protein n=1 Tax=Loa loa TaxID=7209 RepID=A0A1I7VLT6_LOALO
MKFFNEYPRVKGEQYLLKLRRVDEIMHFKKAQGENNRLPEEATSAVSTFKRFGNKPEMCLELFRSSATTIKALNTVISIRISSQMLLFSCITSVMPVSRLDDYNIADDNVINLSVSEFPEPNCKYHIRLYNRNGSELTREVGIGEPVYHHWTCNYKQQQSGLYCILVNNCTISNSRPYSFPVPIIDEFGCSLFPIIMPHVEYDGDLDGGLQTNVFLLDIDQV